MKSYSSRELIKLLNDDGWYFYKASGSHHHFKHPTKKEKSLSPTHEKTSPRKTIENIIKQAGIKPE